jgi:TnpA family transposase
MGREGIRQSGVFEPAFEHYSATAGFGLSRRFDENPPTHDRPTPLARALEELGRIIKTLYIYMLRYIDDEAYRRRILT